MTPAYVDQVGRQFITSKILESSYIYDMSHNTHGSMAKQHMAYAQR
jgi:hypothetical protein